MATASDEPLRRVQLENSVAVTVEAGIDAVWEIVRDVTRVGEWSHECVGAEWLADATAAAPGARFRGRNRAGTRISQQFRVLRAPKLLAVLYALAIPGHRDRTDALVDDLTRLGALASRANGTAVS